jgi:hypothetical protein
MTDEDRETGAIMISGVLVPDLFARMGCALARHSTEKLGKIEAIRLETGEGKKIGAVEIPQWHLTVEFENDHDPATCQWCEAGY